MTGKYLAEIMNNGWLKEALAKHARRYSKKVENQEEYIQDAWLRIAEHEEGESLEYYEERGRMAIKASYDREWYANNVRKKKAQNPNGISVTEKDEKPPPKRAINLYRNKYLDPKHHTLDWQYFENQEEEMIERASFQMGWYNQHEDFDCLDKDEQRKIINKFINSGYQVGMPVGATPGKKARYYEVFPYPYTVENGVVEESMAPRTMELERTVAQPGMGTMPKMDLSAWYKLRDFGGSDEWMGTLNKIISDLEDYIDPNKREGIKNVSTNLHE